MTTMAEITLIVRHFLAEHNIASEGFTLILNFQEANDAARFDVVLHQELAKSAFIISSTPDKALDLSKFQMNGLKIQVESPVHHHDPHQRFVR